MHSVLILMQPVPDFFLPYRQELHILNQADIKRLLLSDADKMSSITDYTDRTTCTLFGDAAGAVLLEPTTEEFGVMDYIFHTDGSGRKFLHLKAGGSVKAGFS